MCICMRVRVSVCVSACERVCVHACIYGCASEWVGSVVVLVIVVYCPRVLFTSLSQCSSSVTLITLGHAPLHRGVYFWVLCLFLFSFCLSVLGARLWRAAASARYRRRAPHARERLFSGSLILQKKNILWSHPLQDPHNVRSYSPYEGNE